VSDCGEFVVVDEESEKMRGRLALIADTSLDSAVAALVRPAEREYSSQASSQHQPDALPPFTPQHLRS
jgi:hypothetical protein